MKKTLYIFLIALLILLSIVVIVKSGDLNDRGDAAVEQTPAPVTAAEEPKRPSIITVEEKISVESLVDSLQDVGKLVTEEYYFTEVVEYSSVKTLWKITLPWTKSAFLISYDGVVSAGVDMTAVRVEVNEESKTIRVITPEAEIMAVDIDFDSFICYSENSGIGNRISIKEFNGALQSVEETARSKAVEKGVLVRAKEHADLLIRTVISSLVDLGEYSLMIERTGT